MYKIVAAIALIGCAGLNPSLPVHAAEAVYYGPGQVPRPIDVARALAGGDYRPSIKKRGVSLGTSVDPADLGEPVPAPTHSDSSEAATGLNVAILFAFDSDQLAAGAYPVLDSLAEGIKLVDASKTVRIIGHTDASGSEIYNLRLSQRRANSVRDYLVKKHGIEAARLYGTGKGESEPLVPDAPKNAKNRRVSFALG